MTRKSPRKFTKEFKEEAIRLVTEHGYTQKDAAESLGIASKNLNRWIHEGVEVKKEPLSEQQKEIHALQKQIRRLELEKEILKKAAAFFASEQK
jgi:transposase